MAALITDQPSSPFPIDALGPTLAGATRALVAAAQCQPSLAGLALLGHAAGAVQAFADVRTPLGKLLTTVSMIVLADSSEGKNLVWNQARAPFEEFERWMDKERAELSIDYEIELSVWKDEFDTLKKAPAEDQRKNVKELKECLQRKPRAPRFAAVTFGGGGTVEGIIKSFGSQPPSAIHSTPEGGQFFRGAAFGDKNSASSGSMIIDLIDSGSADRPIMGNGARDERIKLRDVRLSQVISIQPAVAMPFLSNAELTALGLHARYVKAAPEAISDQRVLDSVNATDVVQDPRIIEYRKVVLEILHAAQFRADHTGGRPHVLKATAVEAYELLPSKAALRISDAFANEIAPQTAKGKRYAVIKEVALKAAERAIRLAGVLHVVDAFSRPAPGGKRRPDMVPLEISAEVMERAVVLVRWVLQEEMSILHDHARGHRKPP